MNLSPLNVDNYPISDTMEQQGTPAQLIFFRLLHKMITNETHSGCIVWLPDGQGFGIPSKQAFTDEILPNYFGQSKFSSFTRRLKRWGFVRKGGFFRHSEFKRDMVFDEDDFDIQSHHPTPIVNANIPSRSKGPLKKRFKQRLPSPPPICLSPSSGIGEDKSSSDIHIMPELLRVINKKKRKERNDLPLLPSEVAEASKSTEEIMVARALASLELKVRQQSSPLVRYEECTQSSVPIPYLIKPKRLSLSKAA